MKWKLLETLALGIYSLCLAGGLIAFSYGDVTSGGKLFLGAFCAMFAAFMFHE